MGVVGPYENEAIRPYVFGEFAELLGAAETHPAMLLYLDQARSIGPNSRAAKMFQRASRDGARPPRAMGLNENLAREILELHTVRIDGRYNQADVTKFARALTGVSVGNLRDGDRIGKAVFREKAREPGARTVMGVCYSSRGKSQAAAILTDLAAKPQTARFVCAKIARHFINDDPPARAITRLEQAWLSSGGDLTQVAETLIDSPEAWEPTPAKFKTPYEFLVSSYRSRSHFEAQDVLETGAAETYGTTSGWLNRSVQVLSAGHPIKALSVGPTAPLILRGKGAYWVLVVARSGPGHLSAPAHAATGPLPK